MSREFLKCVRNALTSSTKVILGFESICHTYFGDRRPNEEMINLLVEVKISVVCVVLTSKQNTLDLDYQFLPIDTIFNTCKAQCLSVYSIQYHGCEI